MTELVEITPSPTQMCGRAAKQGKRTLALALLAPIATLAAWSEPPLQRQAANENQASAASNDQILPNHGTQEAGPAKPEPAEGADVLPQPMELPPPTQPPATFRGEPNAAYIEARENRRSIEAAQADPTLGTQGTAVVLPGLYGRPAHFIRTGAGSPIPPWLQLTGSITVGYDDNVNQTGDGPGEERLGSGFTSIGLSAAMQGMGRLQLFSMTASAGADLYWNQEDPDYHFDLGLVYHRQLVAPAEVTANLRLAYLSRPDYAQVNLVASDASDEGGTNYFLADARATYEYHWTAQFSTATSISANAILYQGNSTDPSYTSYTVGQEARYRTGRFTWIAEGRYSQRQLLDLEGLDSSTVFALLGTEWRLGPWVHVSARGGAELRDAESGGRSSSPYGELGINFQPDLRNRLALVARYGFEFDDLEGGESETFRAGLTYTRTFGPRFTGTLAANFSQSSGGEGASAGEDLSEGDSPSRVTLACFLTLNYRVSTRLSLSASVSSTHSDGEEEVTRNRLSLSANYHF